MANAQGTVTQVFQPGFVNGKKAPGKLTLSTGQDFKSWERIEAEIGQTVDVAYTVETRGQYTNTMISSVTVLSQASHAPESTSGSSYSGSREQSIQQSVALKAAVDLTDAFYGGTPSKDWGEWEATLEKAYQACTSLLERGSLYDPFTDE